MFKGDFLSVQGRIPVELPGDRLAEAELSIELDGKITLTFRAPDLAGALTSQAVSGDLVALGVHYLSAKPSEVPSGRSEGASIDFPGHACSCHFGKDEPCEVCVSLKCDFHAKYWIHMCGDKMTSLPKTHAKCWMCDTPQDPNSPDGYLYDSPQPWSEGRLREIIREEIRNYKADSAGYLNRQMGAE